MDYNVLFAKVLVQHVTAETQDTTQTRPQRSQLRPQQTPWHRFLDELSYLCDFENGGRTVRSIAAEQASHGPTFWIATAPSGIDKLLIHLEHVLDELQKVVRSHGQSDRAQQVERIAKVIHKLSVNASSSRIRHYCKQLTDSMSQVQGELIGATDNRDRHLQIKLEELSSLASNQQYLDITASAYAFRGSQAHQRLQHHLEASHSPDWERLRHCIGRLGSKMKAAKFVAKSAYKFADALMNCKIRVVEPVPKPSPFMVQTDIRELLSQVYPWLGENNANSAAVARTIEKLGTAKRVLDDARGKRHEPQVHPEITNLNNFFTNCLRFMYDDPYIGCSKPSCYCCAKFIFSHPGGFHERPCHGNAWLKWAPPVAPSGRLTSTTEDVLKRVTDDIKEELKTHIIQEIYGRKWRTDSSTGMSYSVRWAGQTATAVEEGT